jgi:hypothetical protein
MFAVSALTIRLVISHKPISYLLLHNHGPPSPRGRFRSPQFQRGAAARLFVIPCIRQQSLNHIIHVFVWFLLCCAFAAQKIEHNVGRALVSQLCTWMPEVSLSIPKRPSTTFVPMGMNCVFPGATNRRQTNSVALEVVSRGPPCSANLLLVSSFTQHTFSTAHANTSDTSRRTKRRKDGDACRS